MNEFNLDELRGRAGATREAYCDSIKMTRALRMRLIETEFEVRRREDLKEKPMDNKGTGKVRTYSATSALRELHHILSHALRTDGIHSFNRVTMSGEWYAIDEDDAERMLAKIQKFLSTRPRRARPAVISYYFGASKFLSTRPRRARHQNSP